MVTCIITTQIKDWNLTKHLRASDHYIPFYVYGEYLLNTYKELLT